MELKVDLEKHEDYFLNPMDNWFVAKLESEYRKEVKDEY